MQVGAVSNVAFQGAVNEKGKKTGGAGKAVASYFIPGLGQFIDGRNKEGAKFLGATLGLGAIGMFLQKDILKASLKGNIEGMMEASLKFTESKTKMAAVLGVGVLALGVKIADMVNAYKGNKEPKAEEVFSVQG